MEVLNDLNTLQAKGSISLLRVKNHSRTSTEDDNTTRLESESTIASQSKSAVLVTCCNRSILFLKPLELVRR